MHRRSFLLALGAIAVRPAQALYDPKLIPLLEPSLGTWTGTLTYRDYQKPDRMVTLKTQMTVSLTAPDELAIYYVFDDGPSKTVYSYERMQIDLNSNQLIWNSGISKPNRSEFKINSASVLDGKSSLAFERKTDKGIDLHILEITKTTWALTKYEYGVGESKNLRSKYEFAKT